MSILYETRKPIRMSDLFDGRLSVFGVTEFVGDKSSDAMRCLTDGDNYLWVYDDENAIAVFKSYSTNDASAILNAISEAFDTAWLDEFDPEFRDWDPDSKDVGVWLW